MSLGASATTPSTFIALTDGSSRETLVHWIRRTGSLLDTVSKLVLGYIFTMMCYGTALASVVVFLLYGTGVMVTTRMGTELLIAL